MDAFLLGAEASVTATAAAAAAICIVFAFRSRSRCWLVEFIPERRRLLQREEALRPVLRSLVRIQGAINRQLVGQPMRIITSEIADELEYIQNIEMVCIHT